MQPARIIGITVYGSFWLGENMQYLKSAILKCNIKTQREMVSRRNKSEVNGSNNVNTYSRFMSFHSAVRVYVA